MAVVSQPDDMEAEVEQPGEVDQDLGEFWVGNPWKIFYEHNLSAFERNRLFLNAGDARFLDISAVSGADDDGDGRGALALDFDHDGDLDLFVRQAGGNPLIAYRNNLPPRNHLDVTLRGRASNRLGIGANLTATVGDRSLVRACFPANSNLSQSPLVVHFGLGDAERVDTLTVRWPSGATQKLTEIPANLHIVVTEGEDGFETTQPGQRIEP